MTPSSPPSRSAPATRSRLRAVAMPSEHGGWGLTAEPALLGLLVAPSASGALLGLAALLAFVARTPLKVVLVDRRRHQHRARTDLALRVLAVELAVLVVLVAAAVALTASPFWWPVLVAGPLVAVELWFDMRSRSRRLVPELAGSVGIGAVAAMIVLADGGAGRLAVGVWLVLAARAITSIPYVRERIAQLHGRPSDPRQLVATDLVAIGIAAAAILLDPALVVGAMAVGGVIVVQRVEGGRPVPPPKVLGMRQMAMGFGVVAATALGVAVVG